MMKNITSDHQKSRSIEITTSTTSWSDEKSGTSASGQNLRGIVREYKMQREAADVPIKRVIRMYNLMKKQTILTCICIISSGLLGMLAGIDIQFSHETGWDHMINMICVWLMLSTSKRYWGWCKDYGLCKCCYLNTGYAKKING